MRDHGGDLDRAKRLYGGDGWLDLSTGINPVPYLVPPLSQADWAALPTKSDIAALEAAAAQAYGTKAEPVALPGAQAAIQLVPRLIARGEARVVAPTYNEHAGALRAQGWTVAEVPDLPALGGATLAIVVNPNNPDGRTWTPEALLKISQQVDLLIVDESFADAVPDLSLAPHIGHETSNILILRSFGKFFGLAGLRLGFALCGAALAQTLRDLAGPWAVSGPAIATGLAAYQDTDWQASTRTRLQQDAARLDALAAQAGWSLVGGTPLFRTFATPDAAAAQERLAQRRVWSRIFPYSDSWLRLGLPGTPEDWDQLEASLRA